MSGTTLMKTIRTGAALLAAATLVACDSPTEEAGEAPVPTVALVEVQWPGGQLEVGQEVQLRAVVRDTQGRPLNQAVVWSSSDTTRATVNASGLLRTRGAGVVQVTAAAGGRNGSTFVSIGTPTPALQRLEPVTAGTGDAGFELRVVGTGFVEGAVVLWKGQPRPTTRVSATELRAEIAAADVRAAGLAEVEVANPLGGGTVNSPRLHFVIEEKVVAPGVYLLTPASAPAGTPGLEVRVTGSRFGPGATLYFNGEARATRVISANELRADLTASDLASAGTFAVAVANPAPGGSFVSASLPFTVSPSPVPAEPTFRLVGLESGEGLPVVVTEGVWVDSTGARHAAIRRATAGTLRYVSSPQGTRWHLVVTIVTYLASTGAEVQRGDYNWWGSLMYDLWTGEAVLRSDQFPGMSFRTKALGEDRLVVYQSLHDSGAAEHAKGWLYVRQ